MYLCKLEEIKPWVKANNPGPTFRPHNFLVWNIVIGVLHSLVELNTTRILFRKSFVNGMPVSFCFNNQILFRKTVKHSAKKAFAQSFIQSNANLKYTSQSGAQLIEYNKTFAASRRRNKISYSISKQLPIEMCGW